MCKIRLFSKDSIRIPCIRKQITYVTVNILVVWCVSFLTHVSFLPVCIYVVLMTQSVIEIGVTIRLCSWFQVASWYIYLPRRLWPS